MIDSSLSDREHVRMIFTGFRKNILIFKSLVKVRKLEILLRLARTFIIPKLHSLEFVNQFTPANISRYEYLIGKFLGVNNEKLQLLLIEHPWLDISTQLKYAQHRYKEIVI